MFSLKKVWNGVCEVAQSIGRKALALVGIVTAGTGLALSPKPAMAAIDVTAVTTGISDAQTAIIAVVTALLGLSVAIFGIVKVYRFVSRKAGA